jgi:hypothetical protein
VIISLNNTNQLISVTVKCHVFFAVWTELLNIIQMTFNFKGLKLLIKKNMQHGAGLTASPNLMNTIFTKKSLQT